MLLNNSLILSRYYLKERAYHGTLVQDEEAERIVKESRQWEMIYNLKAMQVAEELTKQVCLVTYRLILCNLSCDLGF